MWLILGADGQLGQSLQLVLHEVNIEFVAATRTDVDITQRVDCIEFITKINPHVVVNCAAWTAVDLAEDHEEEAFAVNCTGARNIAVACRTSNSKMIHISTDYVFSGISEKPYEVDDKTEPKSVYGQSKLCGETAIQEEMLNDYYIFRTAWLYSRFKGNFVKTMVRKALANQPVRVVADQLGQPTEATDLARHIVDVVTSTASFGIYHGTNSDQASWFELTQEIYSNLGVDESLVTPVATSEYPTKAKRPQYSVLSHLRTKQCGLVEMPHWKTALLQSLPAIAQQILEEENS